MLHFVAGTFIIIVIIFYIKRFSSVMEDYEVETEPVIRKFPPKGDAPEQTLNYRTKRYTEAFINDK